MDQLSSISGKMIPCIHYQRFLSLISTILFEIDSPYGFIVPAFDWESRSLQNIVHSLNLSVNFDLPLDSSISTPSTSSASPIESDKIAEYDATNIMKRVKFQRDLVGGEMSAIEHSFLQDWKSFLDLSGLKPVNIFVSGAPKSGKTTVAKTLSERYDLFSILMIN
jgi:hypothetical protein